MKLAATITLWAAEDQMFRPKDYGQPLVHAPDRQKTVCVDFDGVLTHVQGPYKWGHIGAPRPEGIKFLRMLLAANFKVVILTARKETDLVAKWLGEQGVPGLFVTNHKPPAIIYWDDHGSIWHDDQSAEEAMRITRKAAR